VTAPCTSSLTVTFRWAVSPSRDQDVAHRLGARDEVDPRGCGDRWATLHGEAAGGAERDKEGEEKRTRTSLKQWRARKT
jgi:hypothetical protein